MKRDSNLDLIRMAAMTSVIAVHFFLNSGFYDVPSQGLAADTILRTQLMVCVPLFLLLTGYLNGKKTWSGGYYRGLGKLLLTYALTCVFCCVYRAAAMGGSWSPVQWLRGMLDFTAAPYSWYIEMYVGLFLLIPFLNAAWDALPGDRARLALVWTAILLSIAPSLNVLSAQFGWKLFPAQWSAIYPLAYYFTARWLRDHPTRLRWWQLLGVDIAAAVIGGLLHLRIARGEPIAYLELNYWCGAVPFVCAVSLFALLRKWDTNRLPRRVQWWFYRLGRLSLPVFLLSWIPDQLVYGFLRRPAPEAYLGLRWMLPAVLAVLALSVVLAEVLTLLQEAILRLFRRRRAA